MMNNRHYIKELREAKTLIAKAILYRNLNDLRLIIEKLKKIQPPLLPEENCLLKEVVFECHAYGFIIKNKGNFEDMKPWKEYKKLLASWDKGFDYLIEHFIKILFVAKKYAQVIEACTAMRKVFSELNYTIEFNQFDEKALNKFNKTIDVYERLSQKEIPAHLSTASSSQDIEASTTTKLQEQKIIITAKNEEISRATADMIVNMGMSLASLINVQLATSRNNEQHSPKLLRYLDNLPDDTIASVEELKSNFNKYREPKLNKSIDMYSVATDMIMDALLKNFPIITVAESQRVLETICSVLQPIASDLPTHIAAKLSVCVIGRFTLFQKIYADICEFFIKCDHRFDQSYIKPNELIEWQKNINHYINSVIPKQCLNILAHFHDKASITNVWLISADAQNTEKYKIKIIDHYKKKRFTPNMKKRKEPVSRCANDLYKAHIPLHEVDDDLKKIFLMIKKLILTIPANINATGGNTSINLYSNLFSYLNLLCNDRFDKNIPRKKYDDDQNLSQNIIILFNDVLRELQELGNTKPEMIIQYCQALEFLLDGSGLSTVLSRDDAAKIILKMYHIKLTACIQLIEKSKIVSQQKNGIEVKILHYIGNQYLDAAKITRRIPDYKIEIQVLLDVIHGFIHFYNPSGNKETPSLEELKTYLERGLIFLPEHQEFKSQLVYIEKTILEERIKIINAIPGIRDRKTIFDQLIADIDALKIQPIAENDNTDNMIIAQHKKLVAKQQYLIKQLASLNKDKASVALLFSEHQNLLTGQTWEYIITDNVPKDVHLRLIQVAQTNSFSLEKCDKNLTSSFDKIQNQLVAFKNEQVDLQNTQEELTALIDEAIKRKQLAEIQRMKDIENAEKFRKERTLAQINRKEERYKRELNKCENDLKRQTIESKKHEEELEVLKIKLSNIKQTCISQEKECSKLAVELGELEVELTALELEKIHLACARLETEISNLKTDQQYSAIESLTAEQKLLTLQGDLTTFQNELNTLQHEHAKNISDQQIAADHPILNGRGNRITLNILAILNNLDLDLNAMDSGLIFKTSLTVRFGIFCFNEQPELARKFPVNDIDLQILLNPNVNLEKVFSLLEKYQFVRGKNTKSYVQYMGSIDGIDLEINVIKNARYFSCDYLPLRKGIVEFVKATDENPKSKNQNFVKIHNYTFKLTPPLGYEDTYIKACQFKEFSICEPNLNHKSICYGVFKYLTKLAMCGVNINELNTTQKTSSTNLVYLNDEGLYTALIQHFDKNIHNQTCYYELKDFMVKGIADHNPELAINLLSTLYFSYLKTTYPGYSSDTKSVFSNVAWQCASTFINTYARHCGNIKIKADVTIQHIQNCFLYIASHHVHQLRFAQPTPQPVNYRPTLFAPPTRGRGRGRGQQPYRQKQADVNAPKNQQRL